MAKDFWGKFWEGVGFRRQELAQIHLSVLPQIFLFGKISISWKNRHYTIYIYTHDNHPTITTTPHHHDDMLSSQVERVSVFATGETVQAVTETGLTVVHLCCQSTGPETRHLRLVAQKGASLTERSSNDFCPLHLLAFTGDVEKESHPNIYKLRSTLFLNNTEPDKSLDVSIPRPRCCWST